MDKKKFKMNKIQKIMISIAVILIIVTIYKILCLDASSVNSDALIYASVIIIIIASLNPNNLNKILFKTKDVELSLEKRHEANDNEITFAKKLDEKNFNVKDIENSSIYEEAINRGKREKSDVDYLIIATKLWREKRYEEALKNSYYGLYISKSNNIMSLLNMRIATIIQSINTHKYDFKFSEEQYKKALSYDKRNDKIYNNMAALYLEYKDKNTNLDISFDDISTKLEKAIEINPESFAAHRNLGVVYSKQKKFDESEKAYLKSIELKSDYIDSYNSLAELYMSNEEKKDLTKAFKYLQEAIEIEPENLESNRLIVNYYLLKNDIGNSINHYLKVIRFTSFKELNDDMKSINYSKLGYCYIHKDDFENAKKYLDKAIALNEKNAFAYDSMGELYFKMKDNKKAIEYYEKAIEIDDSDTLNKSNIYNHLGYCYIHKDDFENAKKYLDKAIALNEKNAFAYDSMGELYFKMKDNKKAIEYYEKAIEIDDSDTLNKSNIYNNFGYFYLSINDFENAEKYLNKAIVLNDKNANAYVNMGVLYFEMKDYEKAIEYYEKVIEVNPKSLNDYKKKIDEIKKESGIKN